MSTYMNRILHHRSPESSLYLSKFSVIVVIRLQLCVLNGILLHNNFRQGELSMNIVDILRARITESFPNITPEELRERLSYAYQLLNNIRK